MKFRVFDKVTGKEADREKIGEEKWVKDAGLYRCHRADWFLDEDGGLYLCDPMDHIVYADEERFEVRFEPDYRVCGNCQYCGEELDDEYHFPYLQCCKIASGFDAVKKRQKPCEHWAFCGVME